MVPCSIHNRDSTKRGYDHRWAKTRAAFLKANPLCVQCGATAKHVDHKDGKGPLGPRGHDWSNLQALCASCHGRLTAHDLQGG